MFGTLVMTHSNRSNQRIRERSFGAQLAVACLPNIGHPKGFLAIESKFDFVKMSVECHKEGA